MAQLAHRRGVYLIGRVVVFQDPVLAAARPDLAVQTPGGGVWTTRQGLAWVNPYDKRVWEYAVSVAEVAAKAGFDEIMLDYVRFPSDGDVERAVYPGRTSQARGRVIADFVAYAQKRLKPYGVRISTAVFGLSATRDLRIGQVPKWISAYVDNISPMAYPVLYGGGELGIANPTAEPGETVFRTLEDFRRGAPRHGRAARPVDPGLELRPGAGAPADRGRAAPGSEGLPALERRGPVHESRAGTRAVAPTYLTARAGERRQPSPSRS